MTEPASTSILLVDDERSLREPLAEYLTRQGFVVREADSAAQARTLLAQELPGVMVPLSPAVSPPTRDYDHLCLTPL